MTDFSKIANGLMRDIATPTDELATKRGEDDLVVRVKRNSDRMTACKGHVFEVQPDWRTHALPLTSQRVKCLNCGGEMRAGDAMTYLKGYAHGSGKDYAALCADVWPPR